MAVFDTYSATVQTVVDGSMFLNTFYWQITAVSGNDDDMESLSTIMDDQVIIHMAKWCADAAQFQNIVVRRLAPAITDVLVTTSQRSGDIPQAVLPNSCFMLIRYYSQPYVKGTSYHWKFPALPHDANNRGKISSAQAVRPTDFINALSSQTLNDNGNFFQLINSSDAANGGGNELPQVDKMTVDSLVRNLRPRQSRPVG